MNELYDGVGLAPEILRRSSERIHWDTHSLIFQNVRRHLGPDELRAMGRDAFPSLLKPFAVIGRILFTPAEFYRWINQTREGIGPQMFSCIKPEIVSDEPGRFVVEHRLDPGLTVDPAFFEITRGSFEFVPKILGGTPADVDLNAHETGARLEVRYEPIGGWIQRAWRFLTYPFVAREAAEGMRRAMVELEERYGELDAYRNKLEDMVQERTAELRGARDELSKSLMELQAAQETRDRIFANVNHELRTPMSLITLALADIQRHESALSDRSVSRLGEIQRSVDQLLSLVDELLLLAAGDSGQLRLDLSECAFDELLDWSVSPWVPAAAEQGITLTLEPLEGAILVDTRAFQRVMNNLLSNAIKFTPEGGTITVRATPSESGVELNVQDSGPGLSEGFLKRVFGRFEQDESSKGIARGSGIGLAIVKELVEAHGGSVQAENSESGGAVFRVALPWRPTVSDEDGGTRVPKTQLQATTPQIVRSAPEAETETRDAEGLVLLAEDDPRLRAHMQEILSQRYRVMATENGVEALEVASREAPDLLLTDVQMPEMNGFELADAYRKLPNTRLSPIVFITASHSLPEQLRGFASGAVDFIAKPFSPEVLLARVDAQMSIRRLALRLLEQEKLAEIGFLTAGLAHELRNPANVVSNAAELIGDGSDSPELLTVMRDSARQIGELCENLLGLTRADLASATDTALAEIVRVACSTCRVAIATRTVDISVADTLNVRGSRALLAQVVAVLLDNASKATGPDGRIEIRGYERDGEVILDVSDDGPGVPVELRERIFTPFFTTRSAGEGTGLGLPIARSIVSRQGGSLRIEESGEKMIFRLRVLKGDLTVSH